MNWTFLFYFLFSINTTLGVDYSGFDVGIKKFRSFDTRKMCALEIFNDKFKIVKCLKYNTLLNPLEMWEKKAWMLNKNVLEVSNNNVDKLLLKGFETEMDYVSLNSLYIHTLVKDYKYKDLVVAVRDYYSEDEMKCLAQMFFVKQESNVTVIPASLAFLVDYKLATVKSEDISIVISTVGNKVVFNVYKTANENGKFTISNLHKEVYDDISDNNIKSIILKNVKEQIYEFSKLDEKTSVDFTMYPLLDDKEIVHVKYANLIKEYESIKNAVIANHTSCTVRELFINDSLDDNKKIPLLDIIIDVQKITKDIVFFLELLKSKYENIVQNLKNTMVEKGILINSVYFITEFFEFFKSIFDLEGANKVQNGMIKSGCTSFDKKKVDLKDLIIANNNLFMINNFTRLYEEIKVKTKAKKIIDDIEKNGGLDKMLSDLKAEKFADLNSILENLDKIDLTTAKKIVADYTKLSRENFKTRKWIKERVNKISAIENTLKNTLELENKEPELWLSGLDKHVLKIKEWFENARNNKDVSGDDFEMKYNMLEGYIQAYKNKMIRMKQEEQKKKEDEQKENEDEKKENKDEQENEAALEDKRETDEKKKDQKSSKDNNAIPEMNDFNYNAFQSKFNELMKEEKYKKLKNDLPNMQTQMENMINPDQESREL